MKRTLLSIKTRAITSLVILLMTLPMWGNDGDTFTKETVEGVLLKYTIISESEKTCMVGDKYYPEVPTAQSTGIHRGPAEEVCQASGDITIPEEANGYRVVRIESFAFNQAAITSIFIPNSVETIGSEAFTGCTDLKSVRLPMQLKSIESFTFYGCESLTSIDIPEGMTSIGEYAFANCKQMKEIDIPSSVTNFGQSVFWNTGFTSLPKLPEKLTNIPNGMFYECTQLTSIEIPQNITRIGDTAFGRCPFSEIEIPTSVTHIGVAAFANCKNLTNIVIPDNVTSIGMNGFLGCSKLKAIKLSNNLSSLSKSIFSDCTSLESIIIPSGVKSIGEMAFWKCSSLTTISIPETVDSIDNRVFYGCSSLTNLFIPKSVISIDTRTHWALLYACNSLTSIIVDEDNPVYDSRYNCNAIVETANNKIIAGCTTTTIPEGINAIGYYAFSGYENLTAITLPQSLERIESGAFTKLGLHEISIPENVKSIASYAFNTCKQLETVKTYIKEPIEMPDNAFSWGSSTATLYVPKGTVDKYKAAKGWNVFSSIKEITSSQIEINEQNFPDENFRNYVLSTTIDRNQNKVLDDDEILRVTNIDVHQKKIESLKGIEYFTELQKLTCYQNNLTELDLSACTKLDFLNCPWNKLTSLNLSNCSKLKWIRCDQNQLLELDVSSCTELDTLVCSGNKITTLNVSTCTKLDYFNCQYNNLTKLDVSNNTELFTLYCDMNHLTELDLSKNTKLKDCSCSGNGMTKLILSKDNVLCSLSCSTNRLYGAAMEHIVENLNYQQQEGSLIVFNAEDKDSERNVITTKQVEALNAKGWKVYQWIYSGYSLYKGSTPTEDSDYIPFVELGKKWHVVNTISTYNNICHYEKYTMDEEVERNDKTYTHAYILDPVLSFMPDAGLFREENQRVYKYDETTGRDMMMYDFSLKEGDTFVYEFGLNQPVNCKVLKQGWLTDGPKIATSSTLVADTMETNYRWLRTWTIGRENGAGGYDEVTTWVECIGALENVFSSFESDGGKSCLAYVERRDNQTSYRENVYLPFSFCNIYDVFGQKHGCNLPKTASYISENWNSHLTYELEGDRLHVYGQLVLNCGCYNYAYFFEEPTDDPLVHKLHFEIQDVGEPATCVSLFVTDFYVPGFDPNLNYIIVDNQGQEHPVINKTPKMAYRPFVEEGKVWQVGAVNSGNPVQWVEYYYFDGDTIIDGKTCKQMMCQRYVNPEYAETYSISQNNAVSYVGAWYEEDQKVYEYDTTSNQFKLMYDFSANANDTLLIDNELYVIGPKQTEGIRGFKGVYRSVFPCSGVNTSRSDIWFSRWLEGVGSIDGPTINIIDRQLADPAWFLMSCTIGDEVIYLNDYFEDGATPVILNAPKGRFDFTHIVKDKPKAPKRRGEETSLYGEYNDMQLAINLDPLDEAYLVRITNETGKVVYEKAINAGNIVALNIDISAYPKGRYSITVENSHESFTGEFDTIVTGIVEVRNKKFEPRDGIYNLQGQRISSLQKGLNIVNGRKVMVK